jgi:hypothetical protein
MAQTTISIEDFDNRCQEKFPDTGERCWGMAVKVIQFKDQRRAVCLAHYEKWLEDLKVVQLKNERS